MNPEAPMLDSLEPTGYRGMMKFLFSLFLFSLPSVLGQDAGGSSDSALLEKVRDMAAREETITSTEDPTLTALAQQVLNFLGERDVSAFVAASVSNEATRRALPRNFAPAQLRSILDRRTNQVKNGARELLDMAVKLKLPHNKELYRLMEVKVGWSYLFDPSSSVVLGREVEIRFTLADEAIEELGESHQGDYVVSLESAVRGDRGWSLNGERMGWTSFPTGLLGAEDALLDLKSMAAKGETITSTEDPTLTALAQQVLNFLGERDVSAFVAANAISDEEFGLLPPSITIELSSFLAFGSKDLAPMNDRIANYAQELLDVAVKLKLPQRKAPYRLKGVKVGTTEIDTFDTSPFILGRDVEIRFALADDAIPEPGESHQKDYVVSLNAVVRGDRGWSLLDGLRWSRFPAGILETEDALLLKVKDMVARKKTVSSTVDPALATMAQQILDFLGERDVSAFVEAIAWDEVLKDRRLKDEMKLYAQGLLDMAVELNIPQRKEFYQLEEVKVGVAYIEPLSSFVHGLDVEIRFTLADEAIEELGELHQGDYVVSLQSVVRSDQGWSLGMDGMSWNSFPAGILGTEDALWEKVKGMASRGETISSTEDDPTLTTMAQQVLDFLGERDVSAFVEAIAATDEVIEGLYPQDFPAADQIPNFIATTMDDDRMKNDAQELLDMAVKLKLPQSKEFYQLEEVKVGTTMTHPGVATFMGADVQIRFTLADEAIKELGKSHRGDYVVWLDKVVRSDQGWNYRSGSPNSDGMGWVGFPAGILGAEDEALFRDKDHLREYGVLIPGTKGPGFTFYSLEDGTRHSSEELEGKVVVLEFWASWCGPCQAPMAKLQTHVDDHPEWKDKVEVLALSIDDSAREASAHLARNGWNSTRNVWAGEGRRQADAPSAYKVQGIPVMYVMDGEGTIVISGDPRFLNVPETVNGLLVGAGDSSPDPVAGP